MVSIWEMGGQSHGHCEGSQLYLIDDVSNTGVGIRAGGSLRSGLPVIMAIGGNRERSFREVDSICTEAESLYR